MQDKVLIEELVGLVILPADNLLKTNVLMEKIVGLTNKIANQPKTPGWYKSCRDGESDGLVLGLVFNYTVADPVVHLVHLSCLMRAIRMMNADLESNFVVEVKQFS